MSIQIKYKFCKAIIKNTLNFLIFSNNYTKFNKKKILNGLSEKRKDNGIKDVMIIVIKMTY